MSNKPLGSEIHDLHLPGWDDAVFNFVYEHEDVSPREVAMKLPPDRDDVKLRIERLRRRFVGVRRNGRNSKGEWQYRIVPSEFASISERRADDAQ